MAARCAVRPAGAPRAGRAAQLRRKAVAAPRINLGPAPLRLRVNPALESDAQGVTVKEPSPSGAVAASVGVVTRVPSSVVEEAERRRKEENSFDPDAAVAESPARWDRFKKLGVVQRTFMIWSFVFTFAFKRVMVNAKFTYGKYGGYSEAAKKERLKELAAWLRKGLLRLGPTFIKIGQQFSTRVDVLSPELVAELEKLQDRVPPFSSDTAVGIIEEQMGAPVDEVYDYFDRTPIAAASLGQVHRASFQGEEVVVKVQRPGLRELFEIDLKNLRVIAQWLQSVDPKTDGAARDWVAIYDECARVLYQEIDYREEAKNATEFRQNFEGQDWIKVPAIRWAATREKMMTMEYCPGVKINNTEAIDAMGLDRARLARLSVESYLQQLLRYGLFHADPHPGNIAVDSENGGRLIVYDFGMMGRITPRVRGGLLELFYAVFDKDAQRSLDALVTMGVLVPAGDMTAVRRTADFFLKSFETRLEDQQAQREEMGEEYSESFKGARSKDEKKARRKQILSNIGEDLLVVSRDQPFRFPAAFTFVVRAFSVLDGIGKSLDKRFDISEISRPYARELLIEAQAVALPPQLVQRKRGLERRAKAQTRAIANAFKSPDRMEEVWTLMQQMEAGTFRPRVRALEAERALDRVRAAQGGQLQAVLACTAANVGAVLSVGSWVVEAVSGAGAVAAGAGYVAVAANAAWAAAAFFGLKAFVAYGKVKKLETKEAQIAGTA